MLSVVPLFSRCPPPTAPRGSVSPAWKDIHCTWQTWLTVRISLTPSLATSTQFNMDQILPLPRRYFPGTMVARSFLRIESTFCLWLRSCPHIEDIYKHSLRCLVLKILTWNESFCWSARHPLVLRKQSATDVNTKRGPSLLIKDYWGTDMDKELYQWFHVGCNYSSTP